MKHKHSFYMHCNPVVKLYLPGNNCVINMLHLRCIERYTIIIQEYFGEIYRLIYFNILIYYKSKLHSDRLHKVKMLAKSLHKDKNLQFVTCSKQNKGHTVPWRQPAASASQWWSRRAEGGWGAQYWRTSDTKCRLCVCTLPQLVLLLKQQKRQNIKPRSVWEREGDKVWTLIITQHVYGHPASFDAEAEDGPEHQDDDVVWYYSQTDSCYDVYHVGHEETLHSSKSTEKKQKQHVIYSP